MVVDTVSETKLSQSMILQESKAISGNYNGSQNLNQNHDDGESSGGEEIANVHRWRIKLVFCLFMGDLWSITLNFQ
jgi:hypothetical protein